MQLGDLPSKAALSRFLLSCSLINGSTLFRNSLKSYKSGTYIGREGVGRGKEGERGAEIIGRGEGRGGRGHGG